jgi:hypothetical protein
MPFNRIPVELREYTQWVCWRYEQTNGKKPTKIPYDPVTGLRASTTNPETWRTFSDALEAFASGNYSGIGFVLSNSDPFTFIDLDDPGDDPDIMQGHNNILAQFSNTYSELSPSGKGIHIIGKAKLETACKRHHVELYDKERYMTMTGDVYNDAPIDNIQTMVWKLYGEMGGKPQSKLNDVPHNPERYTDAQVWAKAASADNGALFRKLWAGDWSDYPSQSEADFALIDYLQFHSGNIDQIIRMFRDSGLGKRNKAMRDDYVAAMVARSFDRAQATVLPSTKEYAEKLQAEVKSWQQEFHERVEVGPRPFVDMLPDGLVQDIAGYIYNSAPYPLAEGSILGAMALVDGIAGRTYNVAGDVGLNQFLLLLATSGTGKEAIKDGIMRLVNGLGEKGHGFIGPGHIASGQALNKWMAQNERYCVLSILPEFGPTMRALSYARSGSNDDALRGFLLKIYTANGRGKVLGELAYSDQSKNIAVMQSPSLTLLTEAEPEGFYRSFDRDMISGGLIPRFTMIEYRGPLPVLNTTRQLQVNPLLLNRLGILVDIVQQLSVSNTIIDVKEEQHAADLLRDYNNYARQQSFNSTEIELKPLWNRSHIRVYKIAGTLGLRDPHNPLITQRDVDFAIAVEQQYVNNLISRLSAGTIGDPQSELRQEQFVYEVLADYVVSDYNDLSSSHRSRITPEMKRDLVIPKAFLQMRTATAAPFRKSAHNYGRAGEDALKVVISRLIDAGDISEPINKVSTQETYGKRQTMYKIENPRAILERGRQ